MEPIYDVVVVGGGPAGATSAEILARSGRKVLLLDRAGRIKPCGGAVPPRLMQEFDIPESLLACKVFGASIVAPSGRRETMPIGDDGYVGMVDRDVFDEFLRVRAASAGAERRTGVFSKITRDEGIARVHFGRAESVLTRLVIGADGAVSNVARQEIPGGKNPKYVFAYHEVIETPAQGLDSANCEITYQSKISPDFYGWVFPHGATASIGTGSAVKGFSLRGAVENLRTVSGLTEARTLRREGAPLPIKPLKKWDNGRDVVLAGDAAGIVAPASGEGIYYAMAGGKMAAAAVEDCLVSGDARALAGARKRFMKAHGQVFWILDFMQSFWYANDNRRERFVRICGDKDVQYLTWQAYMNKILVRAKPAAHVRIFLKNMAHLTGLARV